MADWQDHLRRALEEHRWQVAHLARKCSVRRETFYNWLRNAGDRGKPDIEECLKIAEVTGLSLDELFRGVIPDDRIEQLVRDTVAELRERLRHGEADPDVGTPPAAPLRRKRG